MKEVNGDFWLWARGFEAVACLTNGIVKANGDLVMGGGIALEFRNFYPKLAGQLGRLVSKHGNAVYALKSYNPIIFSFPTKNHFKDPSDMNLIAKSAKELRELVDINKIKTVLIGRPGCGLGGLSYEDVKPVIAEFFDFRFTIVHK